MCRYSQTNYKPHFACFKCQKTFKRRRLSDFNKNAVSNLDAKCPQCGDLMADMGLDFASPKKGKTKEWEHLKSLYSVGINFYICGCNGPGYIPNSKEKLIEHFEGIKAIYLKNMEFWRNRIEPTTDKEIQRERSKYWCDISKIPSSKTPKQGAISNADAMQHWFEKIAEVEQKLFIIR